MTFDLNKKILPLILTSCNLTCGILSLTMAFFGFLDLGVYFLLLGGVFDFFDGWLAYKTRCKTELGKRVDSFADLVTFGVAPVFLYLRFSSLVPLSFRLVTIIIYISSTVFRLARFNLLTQRKIKNYFTGLPTTAAGCLLASYLLFSTRFNPRLAGWITTPSIILLSFLMVSDLRYPDLKSIKKRWLFMIIVLCILLHLFLMGSLNLIGIIFIIFLAYLVYGLITGLRLAICNNCHLSMFRLIIF